jgi:outer membrane protein insertion porin family
MKSQPDRFALPFIRRSLIGAAVLALCAAPALAVTPFVVKDIRIEGIQRTEAGTVFSYLPVRVGETFDDDKSVAAIKALYATGFFKDIRLEEETACWSCWSRNALRSTRSTSPAPRNSRKTC